MIEAAQRPADLETEHEEISEWEAPAQLLRVMAHPMRLKILELLSAGSRCVKDLNGLLPIPQPRLSQHIAVLRQAQLIDCHRHGVLRCYYLLRPVLVGQLIEMLKRAHPPCYRALEDVLREKEAVERIDVAQSDDDGPDAEIAAERQVP